MTAGHEFKLVRLDSNRTIGRAWFAVQTRQASRIGYLFDIDLDQSAQGKGLGSLALECIEQEIRQKGAARLELHVFADNARARALYAKRGFVPYGILMGKPLL